MLMVAMLNEEHDCQGEGYISMSALETDFTAQYSTADLHMFT